MRKGSVHYLHYLENEKAMNVQLLQNALIDNRVEIKCNNPPFSNIGTLRSIFKNKVNIVIGTAFLIKHNLALTNAHNIYSRQNKELAQYIEYKFWKTQNHQNERVSRTYQVLYVFIPQQYIQSQKQSIASLHDYALLVLNTIQPLASQYSRFKLEPQQVKEGQSIAICGYPFDLNNKKNKNNMVDSLYGSYGKIIKINDSQIQHNAYTSQGMSGGPMYQSFKRLSKEQIKTFQSKDNQVVNKNKLVLKDPIQNYNSPKINYRLIGIHTRGQKSSKFGIMFTEKIISRINNWIQILGSNQSSKQKHKMKIRKIQYDQDELKMRSFYSSWSKKLMTIKMKQQINRYFYFEINQIDHLSKLGNQFFKDKQKPQEAFKIYRKLIDIYEQTEGQSQHYAQALHKIAQIYLMQGNRQCLKCGQRAIIIKKKNCGQKNIQYCEMLGTIASCFSLQQDYDQSIRNQQKGLQIAQQLGKKFSLQYQKLINCLAVSYHLKGDYDKNITYLKEALQNLKIMNKQNEQFYGLILINIGYAYFFNKNQKATGKKYFYQAYKFFKQKNFQNCFNYTLILERMGDVYYHKQKFQKAYKFYYKSKKAYDRIFKQEINNHSDYLSVKKKLTDLKVYFDSMKNKVQLSSSQSQVDK